MTLGLDRSVRVWNTATRQQLVSFSIAEMAMIAAVGPTPTSPIAVATLEGKILIWTNR